MFRFIFAIVIAASFISFSSSPEFITPWIISYAIDFLRRVSFLFSSITLHIFSPLIFSFFLYFSDYASSSSPLFLFRFLSDIFILP